MFDMTFQVVNNLFKRNGKAIKDIYFTLDKDNEFVKLLTDDEKIALMHFLTDTAFKDVALAHIEDWHIT